MPSDVDFRAIFEAVGSSYLVLDPRLRIVAVTDGYLRATMRERSAVVGRHVFDVFADNAADPDASGVRDLSASLHRVLEGRVSDAMAVQRHDVRRPDGGFEERYWSAVNSPVLGAEGAVDYIVHGVEDVTDLVRRRERALDEKPRVDTRERVELRLLVDSVQDYAIFLVDPSGRVASWNHGAERILGYRADEILGMSVACFHTAADRRAQRPDRELEVARAEGRFEEETWRVRKDGSCFWANIVVTPVYSEGTFVGFAKVTRDLTVVREAEEERVRRAQAEEAVRLRDEFLSLASHELRTPLTALDLQVQGLDERRGGLDPRTVTKLERIAKSSARLRVLIEMLLDVSRIATGRFAINPTDADLAALVADVVERLAERAAADGCEVDVDQRIASAPTRVDPLRMEQVLTNVLDNAFKFGAGRPVRIVVDAQGGEAVVTVIDGGRGVAEKDQERIFGRFERAVSSRHYGGLGLGLYVSREIVTAHGGTISAGSDPGGGARITIRMPLDASQAKAEELQSGDADGLSRNGLHPGGG